MSHPSPLSMRDLPIPWLSTTSGELPFYNSSGPSTSTAGSINEEDSVRPKHMSESYTSFDLPLKSDRQLFERYVNVSGGFRRFPLFFIFELQLRIDLKGMGKLLERRSPYSYNTLVTDHARPRLPRRCRGIQTCSSFTSSWLQACRRKYRFPHDSSSNWVIPCHSQCRPSGHVRTTQSRSRKVGDHQAKHVVIHIDIQLVGVGIYVWGDSYRGLVIRVWRSSSRCLAREKVEDGIR